MYSRKSLRVFVFVCFIVVSRPALSERPLANEGFGNVMTVGGWPILPGSPQCARTGSVTYVPNIDRVKQLTTTTITLLNWDINTGYITTSLTQAERDIAFALAKEVEPRFRDRPTWVVGALPSGYESNCVDSSGVPALCGCAAGIGYFSPVIDAGDPTQVEKLFVWEKINSLLYILNRKDLADTAYVTRCLNMIGPVVGGWKTKL